MRIQSLRGRSGGGKEVVVLAKIFMRCSRPPCNVRYGVRVVADKTFIPLCRNARLRGPWRRFFPGLRSAILVALPPCHGCCLVKKVTTKRIYIPRDFIETLRTHVAGFSALSVPEQWGLARMLWEGSQKRRQHRTEHNALTFSAEELEGHFGRGKFAELFARISLFTRSAGWSKDSKTTRAYWFTSQAREALNAYRSVSTAALVDLLELKGDRMQMVKSLPHAISSTSTTGATCSTSDWAFAKETLKTIPINIEMLDKLRLWLQINVDDPSVEPSMKVYLTAYADMVTKLLRMSQTTVAGPGHLAQVYAIAPSGRLYARGVSLQNTPSLIKAAALHGMWEYDFANCHFSIVSQMSEKHGVSCPAIEHYMANKSAVRKEIADGAGITITQAKQCLLALLYGARTTAWSHGAIPSTIGVPAAETLYDLPTFRALIEDVDRARGAIVSGWPSTANGSLTNASGKAIPGAASVVRKLAHLVQGVEAAVLRAIVTRHADDIVLLQHDGFVSRRQLDCGELEEVVFRGVGYSLRLEEEQLELHPEPRALADRTKDEKAREVPPMLDFDSFDAD